MLFKILPGQIILNKAVINRVHKVKEKIQEVPVRTGVVKMVRPLFGPSFCFTLRSLRLARSTAVFGIIIDMITGMRKKATNVGELLQLKEDMRKLANPEKARVLSGFFKTGKGEYGEGDSFLGIMVPHQRRIAKKYHDLSMSDLRRLISSGIHEERLVCLFILVNRYRNADSGGKKEVVDFYLRNIRYINNWDLVDLSSGPILGDHLMDGDRSMLYEMAKSGDLWKRRIAVMATFVFIKKNDFRDTLRIAEMLLDDRHDLIHKAVGWMLREIGKRDQAKEEEFLKKHYKKMPRTMLRYSIERFDEDKRKGYLRK